MVVCPGRESAQVVVANPPTCRAATLSRHAAHHRPSHQTISFGLFYSRKLSLGANSELDAAHPQEEKRSGLHCIQFFPHMGTGPMTDSSQLAYSTTCCF